MKRKMFILVLILLMMPLPVKGETLDLTPKSESAILMEVTTGEILYQKDPHKRLAPASMTKIMSMMLILEDIKSGGLTWDEKIQVSANAASFGGSQIYLEPGEIMSVEDLFKAVAIASANDATVALAERVAGTEEEFVKQMNKKVKELGLKNTNFVNSSGLDEENHYSSAYDLAVMARELVLKYPEVLKYTSIYEDYLRQDTDEKFWLVNTNNLVRFYEGVDGIKTGHTTKSKYCLTATAKRNNLRVISVVMGIADKSYRNYETTKLLDYAFQQYEVEKTLSKGQVLKEIFVAKAKKTTVKAVLEDDLYILNQKGKPKRNVTYKLEIDKITVPLKAGARIGTLNVIDNNKVLLSVPVITLEKIEKANIWDLFNRYLVEMLTGKIPS
ncbi:MAG TPA: D-alanyl-D-alanine carboxypeptidase [Tenericutes bacterium]|nr:D-alanyl-D-alanine carboxypeptidase [Mycoplasmatota bacterium]